MHTMKALSVDDEMFNLTLIEEMASMLNLEVASFQDPREAALYASQNPIDMAFIDYHMPNMDGRIAAIADVFDALTTRRPYKEPWPFEDGIEYLISNKYTHFDPNLVDYFVMSHNKIKDIFDRFKDE